MGWAIPVKKDDGGKFEKAPAGNHPAVLVGLIDLGTQWQSGYNGEPGKNQHRIYFVYELVTKKVAGKVNENHLVAIDLTMSMHEKAKMRKWVESRLGRKLRDGETYDITADLGQSVLLSVTANEKGYTKVEGVSAVPEGLPVPPPLRKPLAWKLGDPAEALPSWLPYLYGRPIPDVIRDSEEVKSGAVQLGGNPVGVTQPQQAAPHQPTPASPPPAARPRMAPPAKPAEPAAHSRWLCWDETPDGLGDWLPLTAKDFSDWYQTNKIDPATLKVYPDGGDPAQAKPATEYGFPALPPY